MMQIEKAKIIVISVFTIVLIGAGMFFFQQKKSYSESNAVSPATLAIKEEAGGGSQDESSSYTAQLTAYVEQELIGTWKGTLDEPSSADSVYSSYTFQEGGAYTYSDGAATESGTYSVLCDAADMDYNGALTLTSATGSRTVKFYLTSTAPAKMVTDQADPTFMKQ